MVGADAAGHPIRARAAGPPCAAQDSRIGGSEQPARRGGVPHRRHASRVPLCRPPHGAGNRVSSTAAGAGRPGSAPSRAGAGQRESAGSNRRAAAGPRLSSASGSGTPRAVGHTVKRLSVVMRALLCDGHRQAMGAVWRCPNRSNSSHRSNAAMRLCMACHAASAAATRPQSTGRPAATGPRHPAFGRRAIRAWRCGRGAASGRVMRRQAAPCSVQHGRASLAPGPLLGAHYAHRRRCRHRPQARDSPCAPAPVRRRGCCNGRAVCRGTPL